MMLAQRIAHQSLRQLAARPAGLALSTRAPQIIAGSSQRRLAATQTLSSQEANDQILAKQRRQRPVAPHLAIYKPQVTWYLSALNRVTGVALSGPLYLFAAAYVIAPAFGWHLESASIAAAFATWPVALKVMIKSICAFPFTFHSFNGIRHLMWDFTLGITNKQVQVTGWAVVGLSVASSILLAFL